MNTLLLGLLVALGIAVDVSDTVSTPETTAVLMELFTSEGCSSCPPTDAWVQQLDASQPIPGVHLIVLSEHVDYWNHDGWKDPYSSSVITARQDAYLHHLGLSEIYTPQVIVDGASEIRLGSGLQAGKVLQNAGANPKLHVRIDSLTLSADNPELVRARISVDASSEIHHADVFVAVAIDHAASQVLSGENRGKRLTHVSVLQSLTKVGKLDAGKGFTQDCQLKLKSAIDPTNFRVIVFVQEPGPGRVLGAALRKAGQPAPLTVCNRLQQTHAEETASKSPKPGSET